VRPGFHSVRADLYSLSEPKPDHGGGAGGRFRRRAANRIDSRHDDARRALDGGHVTSTSYSTDDVAARESFAYCAKVQREVLQRRLRAMERWG
jgi:hypothetical protein